MAKTTKTASIPAATGDTSYVQAFIDIFEDKMEDKENPQLSPEEKEAILAKVGSQDKLEEGLPLLLQKSMDYQEQIQDCDTKIKQYQAWKKSWKARSDQFLGLLGDLIEKLHIPNKMIRRDGIKLSLSSRSTIEVDEDWLLNIYEPLAEALRQQVPPYIKVALSLDKSKLNAHLKEDNSLLLDHPDRIHTKESKSTSIK